MVVPLKLVQFYGSQLPRPRIYDDVKYSDSRIDPPPSVNDALLSWARDAHWSKGGLSFRHGRLAGTVEGSIRRLRDLEEDEDDEENLTPTPPPPKRSRLLETVAPPVKEVKESPLVKISRDRAAMAKRKKQGGVAETLTEKIRKMKASPPPALMETLEKARKVKTAKEPRAEALASVEKIRSSKKLQKVSVETAAPTRPSKEVQKKAAMETQSPIMAPSLARRSTRLSLEASPPLKEAKSEEADVIVPSSSPSGKDKGSAKSSSRKRKSLPTPTPVSRRKLIIKEDSSDDNSSEEVSPPRRALRRQSR